MSFRKLPDFVAVTAAGIPAVLFAGGYLLTWERVLEPRYFLLHLLSAISASAVCLELSRRGAAAIAAWMSLVLIFVFGYLKFYWILFDPISPQQFFPEYVWPVFRQKELRLPVFSLLTLAFSASCVCILMLFRTMDRFNFRSSVERPAVTEAPGWGGLSLKLLYVLPALIFCILGVVRYFQIGIPGVFTQPLPLRLSGVLYYTQTIIIPCLILVQVMAATRASRAGAARCGIGLLIVWAVGDALVRGSRASLLMVPLLLIFLALNGGVKIRRREVVLVLAIALAALVVSPLGIQYRGLRGEGVGVFQALYELRAGVSLSFSGLYRTLVFFFFRIPGAETLLALLGMYAEPLGDKAVAVMRSADGLSGYITTKIFLSKFMTAYAPSYYGGAYLLGGYGGIIIGAAVSALLSVAGWLFLRGLRLAVLPIAATLYLLVLFFLLTEGPTSMIPKQAFFAIFSVVLCEVIVRSYFYFRGRKSRSGPNLKI